jgi:D-arginine dehydrogenase
MARPDIVVIGGGIAGLSIAWQLALRGRKVTLLEQAPQLCTHSSSRNAAIWLPFDDNLTTAPLARRSAEIFDDLIGSREGWLATRGALVVSGRDSELDGAERGLAAAGLKSRRVGPQEIVELSPGLAGGPELRGIHAGGAGVLDIHAMTEALGAAARRTGCVIRLASEVQGISVVGGRVTAVQLTDGDRIAVGQVVIAAGAWAANLGASCAPGLEITPLRRHLVQLKARPAAAGLTVWRMDDEVYFRPESHGVLASPCDERPSAPCLPSSDDAALETLAQKLEGFAPGLADAEVLRYWACLRTFAIDRELVLGPDARVQGLSWFAGLGGRGMTVGAAAGEWCAEMIEGRVPPRAEVTQVQRLFPLGR